MKRPHVPEVIIRRPNRAPVDVPAPQPANDTPPPESRRRWVGLRGSVEGEFRRGGRVFHDDDLTDAQPVRRAVTP